MRLVDFLLLLLDAHADTLKRLAALLGEDNLMEILEASDESPGEPSREGITQLKINPIWFETSVNGMGNPYTEIEGFVADLHLPSVLEFHLWAYPHYRAFIESPLDLNSRIQGPGGDAGLSLVEEAVTQAQNWVRKLMIPPALSKQAESAAHVSWLRFRANVLKRIGKRPMGPVY